MRHLSILLQSFSLLFAAAVVFPGASCGTLNQKKLVYTTAERHELQISLPRGEGEENYKTNLNGAVEQFFSYKDGSLIYVARNTTWPTPNGERARQVSSTSTRQSAGMDEKGLYWKEIHIEGFTVGYAEVPRSRLERFDRALNSIRLKER